MKLIYELSLSRKCIYVVLPFSLHDGSYPVNLWILLRAAVDRIRSSDRVLDLTSELIYLSDQVSVLLQTFAAAVSFHETYLVQLVLKSLLKW